MSESSNRLKDIFLKALDVASPAERASFVAEACASDPGLQKQIEAMLRAYAVSDSFLEKPAGLLGATVEVGDSSPKPEFLPNDAPGTRIGPYKLLEQIGAGGMGVVYTAQQQEPVRRLVALKIIRPGMDSGQVLARFEAERQALALMDHPNIAKVFDAGQTDDGRPYFVMELVKGTPITQFCDANKTATRQRLELFISVCHAIQHAHQKGIIHRDIKPSNVLVTLYDDQPIVKVIDFGVAKAAGPALTEKTLQTNFGAIIGTPEYMSPEQATFNQLDIDTRSDVYALGVLLYELLTGTTPVDRSKLKEAATLEVLRVVREEDPIRPSVKLSTTEARASIAATRGTDPAKLAQLLRGDLDWIVMKSLEKERNRRYETALGFARDIERYLHDELVEARPPRASYRLRKLVKRNRGVVVAAALVLVVLLAGIAGMTWSLIETRRMRDLESQARQHANENAGKAVAAQDDTAKALTRSEGLRLLLQSELVRSSNPPLATLLAVEGAERHPGLLASNTLLTALDQNREVRTLPIWPQTRAFSQDGRRLLTVSGRDVSIWDVFTGKELVKFPLVPHPHGVDVLPGFEPSNFNILHACFDSEGKWVLTTTDYGCVALWDSLTGKQIALIEKGMVAWSPEDEKNRHHGHEYACPAQFTPDGKFILVAKGRARLWDIASRKDHLELKGHEGPVFWAALSMDGQKIITASRDKTARIWDATTGNQIHVLKAHPKNAIVWAGFSPNGLRAVTVAFSRDGEGRGEYGDKLCRYWDVSSGTELGVIGSPSAGDYQRTAPVQFSADSRWILTYDYHHGFEAEENWHLWDGSTGKHVGRIKSRGRYGHVTFSSDARRIACFGQSLDWWDPKTVEMIHSDHVCGGDPVFSPDGQHLITADGEGVHIWAFGGEAQRKLGDWSHYLTIKVSPDARWLATQRDSNEVIFWNIATGRELSRVKVKEIPSEHNVKVSPDSRLLGLGPWNHKQLSVVEAHTGKLVQSLPIDDYMNDFDINPDCTKLVTVSDRHRLKIWNLVNGKELATPELGPDDQYISRAAFSPDGRWLITDQTRQHALRGAQTGKVVFQLKAGLGSYSFSPREPVFSPDGKRVVTIWNSAPEIAWVWDTQTGKLVSSFTCAEFGGRHLGPVSFSQDGEWIAMAFGSASANIWEAATGKELQVLRGHGAGVNSVVFSADKNLVLTASDDRTVRVWDALTGEVRAVFQGHEEPVVSARFIPDGNVLSIDKKGAARVWPVDPLAAARIRATRQLTDGERKRYEITTQNQ